MKLLIVSQYFPPEIGAPQNRLFELAVRLQAQNVDVTVLTAMPNYPQMEIYDGYQGKKYHFEEINGIKVHRSSIYVSQNRSITSRLRNYFSFVWSSYNIGKKKLESKYDIVLCESPPLFLGMSALKLSRKKKAKFIFNISDLWPESAEKMGIVTNKMFLKMATWLEEYLYKKSDLITCQTMGIEENVSSRFPNKATYWLPNGVDLAYYNPDDYDRNWRKEQGFEEDQTLMFYGGIIGHAQGLEVILNAAKRVENHKIQFILMGTGPEKENLLRLKDALSLENVHFLDPVTKKDMPVIISSVDVAVIPLRKLDLFKGAIPSKIFEACAMKKPVLLGVDGEARDLFIDKGKAGYFFEPENDEHLAEVAIKISSDKELVKSLGNNARNYVDEHFNRNTISANLIKRLQNL